MANDSKLVSIENNMLRITFPYGAFEVSKIKELPGRVYKVEEKAWYVPLRFIRQVYNTLSPLEFKFSNQVWELINKPKVDILQTSLPLFNYQKSGAEFLLNNDGAMLADEPGLGKTLMVLAVCESLKMEKVLYITMKSLIFNVETEIKKWFPKAKITIASVIKQSERLKKYKEDSQYYIINYECVLKDIDILKNLEWDAIICDETTKISNPRTQISKAIKLLKGKKKITMTGTPIANTPADLWSPVEFIQPGLLGNWWSFLNTYCERDYWGSIKNYTNLDHLKARIEPYFLRRLKKEVARELPEKIYQEIIFELSPEERKIYNAVKTEILSDIDALMLSKIDWGTINMVLTKLIRFKQITGHLKLIGEGGKSTKLEVLKELLESILSNGQKAIIFTQFAEMLKILNEELIEYNCASLHGQMKNEDREKAIQKFKTEASCKIFISTEAGGYGLNLQEAEYVIHYDNPWSLSKLEQREGRAHRIGQTKNVIIYSLIAKKTVDEFVKTTLESKRKTASEMFDDIKKILQV